MLLLGRRKAARRPSRLISLVLLLAYIFSLRYLYLHPQSFIDLLHDKTLPSPYFWTYSPHPYRFIFVARPWRWPRLYQVKEGFSKWHQRMRPLEVLRKGRRPASYGCSKNQNNALLFIGVFSIAERRERRDLLRRYEKPRHEMVNRERVEFFFILGRPEAAEESETLEKEAREYGDIVILEEEENMNSGKTYHFYRHLVNRKQPPPQFVFKADDDVSLFPFYFWSRRIIKDPHN